MLYAHFCDFIDAQPLTNPTEVKHVLILFICVTYTLLTESTLEEILVKLSQCKSETIFHWFHELTENNGSIMLRVIQKPSEAYNLNN